MKEQLLHKVENIVAKWEIPHNILQECFRTSSATEASESVFMHVGNGKDTCLIINES